MKYTSLILNIPIYTLYYTIFRFHFLLILILYTNTVKLIGFCLFMGNILHIFEEVPPYISPPDPVKWCKFIPDHSTVYAGHGARRTIQQDTFVWPLGDDRLNWCGKRAPIFIPILY